MNESRLFVLMDVVRKMGPRGGTLLEIATKVGCSSTTARKHLKHLEIQGEVGWDVFQTGRRGRPMKLYYSRQER